jgi:hypothetical protein
MRASVGAFAQIDVVPQVAARETHERPGEFSVNWKKGVFQHNPPEAVIAARPAFDRGAEFDVSSPT